MGLLTQVLDKLTAKTLGFFLAGLFLSHINSLIQSPLQPANRWIYTSGCMGMQGLRKTHLKLAPPFKKRTHSQVLPKTWPAFKVGQIPSDIVLFIISASVAVRCPVFCLQHCIYTRPFSDSQPVIRNAACLSSCNTNACWHKHLWF